MPEETKVSKAQQKAVHKYVKNNYDRMDVTVPKGRKDIIKTHAANHGESVNAFINRAIDETMSRDNLPDKEEQAEIDLNPTTEYAILIIEKGKATEAAYPLNN